MTYVTLSGCSVTTVTVDSASGCSVSKQALALFHPWCLLTVTLPTNTMVANFDFKMVATYSKRRAAVMRFLRLGMVYLLLIFLKSTECRRQYRRAMSTYSSIIGAGPAGVMGMQCICEKRSSKCAHNRPKVVSLAITQKTHFCVFLRLVKVAQAKQTAYNRSSPSKYILIDFSTKN